MAVQAFPYFVMTDGVTSCVFADGLGGAVSYPPLREGWAPAISALRHSELGGAGMYNYVVEELEIIVTGATAAATMANLATLSHLLDQAERWWLRFEAVSPVLIKYAPQGSTVSSTAAPLQAVVLGRAEGDETNLSLPIRFNDVGMIYEIRTVRVRFLRRSLWLQAQESAASANTSSPLALTSTFASSATVLCPLSLEIAGFNATNDMQVGAHMVLWTPTSADMTFKEAEALASGNFTGVVEATARSGNILRFTPASTALDTTSQVVTMGIPSTQQRIDIYIMVRNNDTTKTYQMRARCIPRHSSAANDVVSGSWIPIDGSTNFTRPIALGSFVTLNGWSICFLEVIPSATGGTLDMDYLIFQCRDIPSASGAVAIRVNSVPGYTGTYSLTLNDNSLDGRTPTLSDHDTSGLGDNDKYLSYQGDLNINQIGSTIAMVWMSSSGTKFGQRNNADSANVSVGLTARRRPAYLVPQ